jgi:hypothetical protein
LGPYWLLLEASGDSTWRLQLLGDSHHEAEITAVDEVSWNPAFVSDNRFNL